MSFSRISSRVPAKVYTAFINGTSIASSVVSSMPLIDANTNEETGLQWTPSSKEDVEIAMESCKTSEWNQMNNPMERSSILFRAADLMEKERDTLALYEAIDTGRPLGETSTVDIDTSIECLRYYAGLIPVLNGSYVDLPQGNFGYTRREPLGITAGIGPWNYPLQAAVWKSAPALAFGNTMTFKPSEETPLGALALAEIYHKAGLPKGAFNVVLGDAAIGTALVQHEDVVKVSFTGSVETGEKVYSQAAMMLKKCTMELGGKSPLVLFDDVDVDQAVDIAMIANWYSSGQVCSNGTRVFVPQKHHDEFVEKLIEKTKELRIGHCLEETTHVGPLIHQRHLNKVIDYIAKGKEEGASLEYGGERALQHDPVLCNGNFLSPAIFTGCTDQMTIAQEEIFGMVMCVLPYETEQEVVERANKSRFGLSAGVVTKDAKRAHRIAHQLKAGVVWINNYNTTPIQLPWGGVKASGLGRENGYEGALEWTQLKTIVVEQNKVENLFI